VERSGTCPKFIEVWELEDDAATRWGENEFGGRYWTNETAHLIDPLYMLSLDTPPGDGRVLIPIFDSSKDYRNFRGFTYILPCYRKESGAQAKTRGMPKGKRQSSN
jgi:hypothetical protein